MGSGNRIIFEASIDTEPFRRSIGEMTEITNVFFDVAEERAGYLSEILGRMWGNFQTPYFNVSGLERVREELGYVQEKAEGTFSAMEALRRVVSGTVTGAGSGAAAGSIVPGVGNLVGAAAGAHIGSAWALIEITLENLNGIIAGINNLLSGSTEDLTQSVVRSYQDMADEVSTIIQSKGCFWSGIDDDRLCSTEGTNANVTRSFRKMADEASGDVLTSFSALPDEISTHALDPLERKTGLFYENFKEGTAVTTGTVRRTFEEMKRDIARDTINPLGADLDNFFDDYTFNAEEANDDVKGFFEGMSKDVLLKSIGFLKEKWFQFWEFFAEGTEISCGTVRGFFEALPEEIRNPINGIISLINGMVQAVITGLNSVIGGINNINIDLPPWLGGGSFRPNIPKIPHVQIPMLARGGIVAQPTLALIGERGKEAVMPLENNTGWINDLANTIGSVVGAQLVFNQSRNDNSDFRVNRSINFNIDGVKIAEAIMDDLMEVSYTRDLGMFVNRV